MTARDNDTLTGVLHTLIPVPDMPPEPQRIEFALPPVLVLAGLGVLVVIIFTWHVCAVIIGRSRSRNPFRTAVTLAIPMVVLVLSAGITDTLQRHRRDQQIETWRDLRRVTAREAADSLQDAYGFTFDQTTAYVPVVEQDWATDQPVTLADGTATTCWFATTDGHYTVTCGDTENTATPLEPLDP
ncbi:hypothetical protein [Cellulomonas iranensis]|uniref:hypothetical protein n=1 Tax=Cellulomonas iranensis TaxID=76862 RepID=UPI000B3C089B|nr:hypothetical protein [Cellulomonas iranensis]